MKLLQKKQLLKLTIAFHVKMYWADGLLYDICPLYENPQKFLSSLSTVFLSYRHFYLWCFLFAWTVRKPTAKILNHPYKVYRVWNNRNSWHKFYGPTIYLRFHLILLITLFFLYLNFLTSFFLASYYWILCVFRTMIKIKVR